MSPDFCARNFNQGDWTCPECEFGILQGPVKSERMEEELIIQVFQCDFCGHEEVDYLD